MEQRPPKTYVTPAEYLEAEEQAVSKHEYHDGEVVAMAGASAAHSIITTNFIGETRAKLKGSPCRVYESNLKCYVAASNRFFYPDAQIACGTLEHSEHDRTRPRSITNPRVVIEVTSESTGEFDRSNKLHHYQQLPSLREYVLISQSEPSVQVLERRDDGTWIMRASHGLDAVARLVSVDVELSLAELYDGVNFDDRIRLL